MRILVAHNYYQQPGGEDQCVVSEIAMLSAHGHEVAHYRLHNDSIGEMGRLRLASRTIWSDRAYRDLRDSIRARRPDIVHFHNTFPLISPSAYHAARAEKVAVVQTLHNFRFLCARADLFRAGKVCEDCVGKSIIWPSVLHKCYRGDVGANLVVATMLAVHRSIGTWRDSVSMYIALSDASRRKLIAGGLPAAKIMIKPNFAAPDPGAGVGQGGYIVFIGRLSPEKGLATLMNAWRRHGDLPPLKIVGNGPMASTLQEASRGDRRIEWLGAQSLDVVYSLIGDAACLVLTSECYENCPRVVIESFAKGTPAVVSELGAMAELVEHGRTGAHFKPGDPDDLAEKVRDILTDAERLKQMRRAARRAYEGKFTEEVNYAKLMYIYERALNSVVGEELD
jgi:glycosyltransferase involved in cell wall biosynthesis